jgi:hypothetical protein
MSESDEQFSVATLGLTTIVAVGLALLRVGLDGSSVLFLLGVFSLLGVAGAVIGYIGHGREGVVSGAIVVAFLGMLIWPIVGSIVAVLAVVLHLA